MNEIIRTFDECMNDFQEQMSFLNDSINSFDSGKTSEIKRTTVVIRNLLKDKGRTKSLLTQLSKKDIPFISSTLSKTGDYIVFKSGSSNLNVQLYRIYHGLVYRELSQSNGKTDFFFQPIFKQPSFMVMKELSFQDWWNEVVFENNEENLKLTRSDLILSIAEQDGGAHIDPTIGGDYHIFKQRDSKSIVINGQKVNFANNPAFGSVRQIIFELYETFSNDDFLTNLIPERPSQVDAKDFSNVQFEWYNYIEFLELHWPNEETNKDLETYVFDLMKEKKYDFRHLIAAISKNKVVLSEIISELPDEKLNRSILIALYMQMQYRSVGFGKNLNSELARIGEKWNDRIK